MFIKVLTYLRSMQVAKCWLLNAYKLTNGLWVQNDA